MTFLVPSINSTRKRIVRVLLLSILYSGLSTLALPPATAAPYLPKIAAEMIARGETVPSCRSARGDLWNKYVQRTPPPYTPPPGGKMAPNKPTSPSGGLKIAALLVQFQQDAVTSTTGKGQFLLDGDGDTRAVGDTVRITLNRADTYYRAVSYGKLQLSYTVFDTLMVTVHNTMDNYSSSDQNLLSLIIEVLERVDTWVNFGVYDIVILFDAGMAIQVSGRSGDLPAGLFDSLEDSYTDRQTQDTVTLGILMPATAGPSPISPLDSVTMLGVVCHELGHGFGLPDLYNTVSSSSGVADWSLMASGGYLGLPAGDSPSWMDPWSREYLSWADTIVLKTDSAPALNPCESDSKNYKIFSEINKDTDYFLFEFRGPINSGLDTSPGNGVVIWHVDNSMGSFANNDVNSIPSVAHRRVDVVEADSSDVDVVASTVGVPWPGSQNKTAFGNSTVPNSRPWSGSQARFEIENIQLVGGKALFTAFIRDTQYKTWFVNDASTASDSFTYSPGSDTTGVGSPAAPFRTITAALKKVKSCETIYIDAGTYPETVVIDTNNIALIGKDSNATVINPPGPNNQSLAYGVSATGRQNLLIKNLGILDAERGISFSDVDRSTITGDSVSTCDFGMYILSSSETNTISNNTVNSNYHGIVVLSDSYNIIQNNVTRNNTASGIGIQDAAYNIIQQNESTGNDTGVWIIGNCVSNTISKNNIFSNSTNVKNSGGLAQTLARNWFGTADSVAINAKIADTASAWQPYRLGIVDTTANADTVAPKAPDTVAIIGQGASDTSIILEWSSVTKNEETAAGGVALSGYRVYRGTVKDTSLWIRVGQVGSSAIRYQDTNVLQGQTYYYRVTAFDTASPFANESFYSDSQPSDAALNSSLKNWFVNDTRAATDSFTYAGGSDTSYGDGSRSKPFRSVARALQSAKSGEVIYVDAGLYNDTYVTVSSTETAAFKIDTDNITIIGKDSASTIIDPPGANTVVGLYGIYADTQTGLLVKNIGVTGAYDGIHFYNVDLSTLSGDSASANGGMGIYLLNGSDTNTLSGNTANANSFHGIYLASNSNGNTVSGNATNSNSYEGIYLYSSSNNNTVSGNTVKTNADAGIRVSNSDTNVVVQNDIFGNDTGVWIEGSSRNNVISKNNITGNAVNNVYNQGGLAQTLTRNWFGSADSVTIRAKIADTASAWSPYRLAVIDTTAVADTVAPKSPDTVAILGLPSDTLIVIEWSAVTANEDANAGGAGLSGYRVYRSNMQDTSSWVQVAQLGSGTIRYQDTNVSLANNNYYYRVTAFDGASPFVNESFYSDSQPYYDSTTAAPRVNWYVNDASTAGDSYTYSAGSELMGDGTAQNPLLSLSKAMSLATAGDTIWLDAGLYTSTMYIGGAESAVIYVITDSISLIGKDSSSTVLNPPGSSFTFYQYGIYATGRINLLIRNLAVCDAEYGMKFINVDRSTITGDSISVCQYGISMSSGSDTNTISVSVFKGAEQRDIEISNSSGNSIGNNYFSVGSSGVRLFGGFGNTISNNTMASQSGNAIDLSGGSANLISSNTITGGDYPIFLSSDNNTVTGNTISNTGFDGIELFGGSANMIIGNTVTSCYNAAVELVNSSANNIFKSNLLTASRYGVYLSTTSTGTNNLFVQNTIRDNSQYQVYIYYSSTDTFEKNNIKPSSTNPDSAVSIPYTVSTPQTIFDRNYWYTTDSLTIRKRISQASGFDSVIYQPWRLTEVDTTVGADTTAPHAPDTVAAVAQSASETSIILEWSAVAAQEEANGGAVGLSGYRVYRSTVKDTSSWPMVAQVGSSTIRYQDTSAASYTRYYYRVTAYDAAGPWVNESFYSDSQASAQRRILTSYRLNKPDTVSAGTSFALKIVALDQYAETYTGSVNTVTLAVDSGAVTPTASASFGSGVSLCTVSITVGGVRLLTMTDSSGLTARAYLGNYSISDTPLNVTIEGRGTNRSGIHMVVYVAGGDTLNDGYTDSSGAFVIPSIGDGTFTVKIKESRTLRMSGTMTVSGGKITNFTFSGNTLKGGDANDDNYVTDADYSILAPAWMTQSGNSKYDARADFNNDGYVTDADYSIFAPNWMKSGD